MNKIDRSKIKKPECLLNKADDWTKDLIEKRTLNPSYWNWNWHQYKYKRVEQILIEPLAKITDECCSYCNIRPVRKGALKPSIDHFKPKSEYPELAFEWTNLFLSCYQCQEYKSSSFPVIEPLKPDTAEYDFDYWFEPNFKTGEIFPNSTRNKNEQKRAKVTIEWLGLNKDSRPTSRNNALEEYNKCEDADISNWSYPYFQKKKKN